MATYKNTLGTELTVNNITFLPYETKSTQYILMHGSLTLISEEPYYNPIIYDETLTITSTFTLNLRRGASLLRLTPISGGTLEVYFNNILNTPPLVLVETTQLEDFGRFSSLIFVGSGVVNIKQLI